MLKPLLALLLVLAALSGGIYAFHGSKKGSKRPKTDDASLLLRRYEQYFPTPPSGTPALRAPERRLVSRHVIAVIIAALVLATAAFFGLGQTLEASAVPTTTASVAIIDNVSLHDDLRSSAWQAVAAPTPVVASAEQLPPPAAPPVEAAATAPPPTEAPPPAPTAEPAPAPEPEPAANAYVPVAYPAGSIEAIICSMPWPCGEAISVAQCESGTDRNGNLDGNWATNGNHFGLFQISYIHAWRWADFYDAWMDPARNVQYAYEIWSESGWRPWSCRPY